MRRILVSKMCDSLHSRQRREVSESKKLVQTIPTHFWIACGLLSAEMDGSSHARVTANDPSSATRRTGRNACNHDAPAGFAAALGWATRFSSPDTVSQTMCVDSSLRTWLSRHKAPAEYRSNSPVSCASKSNRRDASQRQKSAGSFNVPKWPNDPSSATRRTGRDNCNRDTHAGFAAAHG
jgi:hypothetical protein